MSGEDGMDTLLLGVDAGCLPVFDPLSEAGVIPNIDALREEGVAAPLESQIPPWTPSAWPSIHTGVNPGKHGVFGFLDYDGYDWRVVNGDDVREFAIWELLDREGLTSVVVNAPVTDPPAEIDGAIVPGFIGPAGPTCHPEGTLEELREALGAYRVYPSYPRGDESVPVEQKREEYTNLVRMRGEAFRYLAEKHDPDFGYVQFQKTDSAFHEFGGNREVVQAVYGEADDQIGAILDDCDPDRVFLVSDHGMGRYDEYEFRVNQFLEDEGYVAETKGGKGMPGWGPIRDDLREGREVDSWEPTTAERIAAAAATYGVTASRIREGLEKVHLAGVAKKYAPTNVTRTANKQVDFRNSTGYLRSRTELGIRLNVEGREPEGVVSPDEYDAVRDELIEALRGVETPDGEPVFERVAPREAFFEGPYVEDAVDIVTVPNEFRHFLSDQLLGEQFAPTKRWTHKLDGVFVAAGDAVDAEAMGEDARPHLFDVAPTLMSSLGVEYSRRMDGSSLPVVDDVGDREYPDYEAEEEPRREEPDADVEDRLADLGYIG